MSKKNLGGWTILFAIAGLFILSLVVDVGWKQAMAVLGTVVVGALALVWAIILITSD